MYCEENKYCGQRSHIRVILKGFLHKSGNPQLKSHFIIIIRQAMFTPMFQLALYSLKRSLQFIKLYFFWLDFTVPCVYKAEKECIHVDRHNIMQLLKPQQGADFPTY